MLATFTYKGGNILPEQKKTQWHPAFTGAIHMEFLENKNDLEFQSEVVLNTMPLRVDMILIKKKKEVVLKNEIGRLFRTHNLLEYKSPKDTLNFNTFLKGIAYVYLYKSNEKYVDEIPLSEVTLTFIRDKIPTKLFKKIKESNFLVEEAAKGIYYINRYCEFPIQVIATRELDEELHVWINSLTSSISEGHMQKLMDVTTNLTELDDKRYASSVWEVVSVENRDLVELLRRSQEMYRVWDEVMKPEIDKAYDDGYDNGKQRQVFDFLKKGIISYDVAVSESNLTKENFEKKYQEYLG